MANPEPGGLQLPTRHQADRSQPDLEDIVPKILFVDDDLYNLEIYSDYLTRKGYTVVVAADLVAGQAANRNDEFDLVIVDARLREPDGPSHNTGRRWAAELLANGKRVIVSASNPTDIWWPGVSIMPRTVRVDVLEFTIRTQLSLSGPPQAPDKPEGGSK